MQRRNKSGKSSGKNAKVNMLDMDLKDILREHALRFLPAKTLFRSLTVCRDWKLQISTPFFIHNQSVSCRFFSGVFVQPPGAPPYFLSLDQMAYGVPDQQLKFLPEPVDVKSSANGLLCCVGRGPGRAYYVCNPVNQQWKKLPKPSNDHGPNPAIAIVFEPSVLNFIAEFKVVCVFASTDIEEAYEFDIYSSDRDSWKVSSEMYFINSKYLYGRGNAQGFQFGRVMYVDGVVYWSMSCGRTLSLDMRTQKAAESTYGYVYGGYLSPFLGTMDGHLCTAYIRNQSIYVTIIHNRHANTMSSRAREANLNKTHESCLNSEVVKISGHDVPKVLLTWDGIVVFRVGSDVFSHDMKTNKTKALMQGERNITEGYTIVPYVNSLVSLV
ncbi:uncharacterized protein LOC141599226 [Silene latifolia]|uniref:uncharacterized protein LOC141599226 n=1 Tax=Silene latifolia TaxID=37657 RepID=UPI003D7784E2